MLFNEAFLNLLRHAKYDQLFQLKDNGAYVNLNMCEDL